MRLPVPDIKAAQDLAERKGLPCQIYIKMLLHEAIEKERRSASSPPAAPMPRAVRGNELGAKLRQPYQLGHRAVIGSGLALRFPASF